MTVTITQGHVLEVLAAMPAKSVHVCVTSPPYWNLRNYGCPPQIWGGSSECDHLWGPAITDKKRGQDAGDTARVGNTVARVCPPETQQGAFCTACGAWRGELGSEPTLDLFVRHLVEVFTAVGRVLRDDGTLWINLGDSYASGEVGRHDAGDPVRREVLGTTRKFEGRERSQSGAVSGLPSGNLCMAPARFALAMQEAGWTLRSEITLCKTAPMPESVQGARWERCRVKVAKNKAVDPLGRGGQQQMLENPERHAGVNPDWLAEWADCPGCPKCSSTDGLVQRWGSGRPTSATEKLYLFVKAGARYFYDLEATRLPLAQATVEDGRSERGQRGTTGEYGLVDGNAGFNPAGRNAWNWMYFRPEPLAHAHYAAFPRFIPRLAIQAGTSEAGVCPTCQAPWLRVVARTSSASEAAERPKHLQSTSSGLSLSGHAGSGWDDRGATSTTLGWRPSCYCAALEPVPATVLDCFGGSGTTGIEANALGRHAVLVELQERYVEIAHQRLAGQPLSLFAYEEPGAAGA